MLEELKRHYVSTVLAGKDYQGAEKAVREANINIEELTETIKAKEEDVHRLEAIISENATGVEKINEILNRLFMGNSDIKLIVNN